VRLDLLLEIPIFRDVRDRLFELKAAPRSANATRRELLASDECGLLYLRRAAAVHDVVNA